MATKKAYNFGEKTEEFVGKEKVPVWQTPKYLQSKEKAIELLNTYSFLKEGDFWILMNKTRNGKMAYTGLIISHNACLKLNAHQPEEKKFKVECMCTRISDYFGMLLYEYNNPEQGLYEVGEVSQGNCKNEYPHAMAFKRLFDRVVLKLTGIAYEGIYSDSEADEFKEPEKEESIKEGYSCEVCGAITQGTNKRTASELKEASIAKYGQPLCPRCANGVDEYESRAKAEGGKE